MISLNLMDALGNRQVLETWDSWTYYLGYHGLLQQSAAR